MATNRLPVPGWAPSPKTRNGADLAVDPTLAGSWTPKGTWRPGVSMPVPRSSCEHSRSASIRPALAPAPVPSGAEIDREDQLPAARRFRDRMSSTCTSSGFRLARRLCEILGSSRQIRPFRSCALAASTVWDLVCTRTNLCAFRFSSLHHAASRHRVSAVPKSLLPRRSFDLCLGRANPRFDVLKVRAATDSGKRGTVQLSTFSLNASGQRWITQRFVAETPIYPRSRWPSRRSRSALSLMKPAASCWS